MFSSQPDTIYGFYRITIPKGKIKLIASYVGYRTKIIELDLIQDTLINFALEPNIILNEAIIKASKGEFLESTQTSLDKISLITIKEMPVLADEVDLIKSLQLLPGVHVGTEATEKDKFKFNQAGIVLEFNPTEKTMLLKQGGGQFTFTKE